MICPSGAIALCEAGVDFVIHAVDCSVEDRRSAAFPAIDRASTRERRARRLGPYACLPSSEIDSTHPTSGGIIPFSTSSYERSTACRPTLRSIRNHGDT